ncbi:transmembrane and coiled-coil domain-containing protein 4 [Quercus suber]|uniref:Transmembrane and coiled-coil domain-containing protein 4 n=1 Tax=Quercus suber TaxID=58331 RepID=A0AAW0J125_QUESU
MATTSYLTPTQSYAAGALFGLALHQAQIHQTNPLGLVDPTDDRTETSDSSSSSNDAVSEDPGLWVHQNSGLLRPFLRLLAEESGENSSQREDQELALSTAVDVTARSMEEDSESSKSKREKLHEYEHECREKFSTAEVQSNLEAEDVHLLQETDSNTFEIKDTDHMLMSKMTEKPIEEVTMVSYRRKVTVLYVLLSACLADTSDENKKCNRQRKGYDARHRVALRLLATWFDIKWTKMEAIEIMVACSAMALAKEGESKREEEKQPSKNKWAKWKRGGIIGAAAVTGGALMAITGGLAAPAIAAGLSALAPTLGTLIPVIGAGGFAAAASAAGTVAGSVAVAASFGAAGAGLTGTKMARRVGSVDEFEFKAIGENHNQGRLAVEILVSGFVFDEEDFVRPWEGQNDNLERYVLQWESKNLIAVSTAIQDWLTSGLALQMMKQGAMLTVLSTLVTALAWPAALLAATDFIDSKWTIAVDRSDKAGKLLAEVLLSGLQGNRPVTLVGYSLGARVIFKCLQFLAETERDAELVERVVLLGAPISINDENWEAARKMVAGRFVNAYSKNDWMLGVAFRASLLTQGLAGIQPINIPGIENVDVTDLIEGHSSYLWATQLVLDQLELDTYYPVFRSTTCKQ